jgi:23S rRNA pseudouridine2605 synthase
VTVNGRVAGLGDRADPERDAIKVDGKRVRPPARHRYLLLNKPRAVMSTVADPEGRPTVMDLVPPALRKALVPVGRLDFLTEGLLLLTDDGDLAQRVTHPRYGCAKLYEAKVEGEPGERALAKLRGGIVLHGRKTAPAAIVRHRPRGGRPAEPGATSWWRIELREGRTRQIREMFQRVGHSVLRLRRIAIGPIADPGLPLGAVRELTEDEVEALRRNAPGRTAAGRSSAGRADAGRRKTGRPGGAAPATGLGPARPRPARAAGGSGGVGGARRPAGPRRGGGAAGGRGRGKRSRPRRGGGGG